MSMLGTAKRIRRDFLRTRRIRQAARHCRQLSGPQRFTLTPASVVVCTLVRDALYWLPDFLDHHRKLGAAGFAICDTGSRDGTIPFLKGQRDVALVQTDLPMSEENALRGLLARRYAAGGWALFADSDELFDYPGSETIPLDRLTAHLMQQGFTGLPAIMLDLFPEGPLSAFDTKDYATTRAQFRFYEWGTVMACDYFDPKTGFSQLLEQNIAAAPDLKLYWGGVRQRLFDEHPCLSKTPLVRVAPGISPGAHPHCASGAVRLADFHAVLKHYKFTNRMFERDRASMAGKLFGHGHDAQRLEASARLGAVTMHSPAAREYGDAAQFLRQEGFARPEHLASLLSGSL